MEYLELIKSSSGDLNVQLAGIARISSVLKQQPTPVLANSVALHMAVLFQQSPNTLKYFIAKFFCERSREIHLVRSRRELFLPIVSVFNTNDPIAQVLSLRILEALAPLLTDSQDVQHKVLLALESKHMRVVDTAVAVLPKLLVSSSTLARHLFSKDLQPPTLAKLVNSRYDDVETINSACVAVYRVFHGAERLSVLTQMAIKSPLMRSYAESVLQNATECNAEGLLEKLHASLEKKSKETVRGEGWSNWELYTQAKYAMQNGEFARALELLGMIDKKGLSEKVCDWLDVLGSLCRAELSNEPQDLYLIVLKLHSLGQGVAVIFHSKFVAARLTFLQILRNNLSVAADALETKKQYNSLLTLFSSIDSRTILELKKAREAAGMLALCLQSHPLMTLQAYYPTVSEEILRVLPSSGDVRSKAKQFFAEQAFCYPPQFFKFNKPLSFTLIVQPESPVKLLMGQPLLLEVQAKLKHILRQKRNLQFTVSITKLDANESCENLEQLRELDASGAVSTVLQVKLTTIGRWKVAISASLVSSRMNLVGKAETCELIVDYA
mmetsp:Transcript_26455/g.47469  ORF Transcript_26455/g.47469 Transcript_26455/m.47469 type:complete len:554 (+) Transcript_26455:1506-3167(+)